MEPGLYATAQVKGRSGRASTHDWRGAPPQAPRPIRLVDTLAWKTIGAAVTSNDGAWFAYRIAPAEGDAEIVVRQTRSDKEFKFGAGESGGNDVAFSEDSKWVAFSVSR